MNEGERVLLQTQRKGREKSGIAGCKLMCGPPTGRGGRVIEVAGIKLARGRKVMVPGDADMFMPVK